MIGGDSFLLGVGGGDRGRMNSMRGHGSSSAQPIYDVVDENELEQPVQMDASVSNFT